VRSPEFDVTCYHGRNVSPRQYRILFLLRHFVAKWQVGCNQLALYGCIQSVVRPLTGIVDVSV
jgi:hypothetical protein